MWCRHCQQDVAARPHPETRLLECSKCRATIPRHLHAEDTNLSSSHPTQASSHANQDVDQQPLSFRWRLDSAHAFAHEQSSEPASQSLPQIRQAAEEDLSQLKTWAAQARMETNTSINLAWGVALLLVLMTVVAGAGVAVGQTHHAILLLIIAQSLSAFVLVTWAYLKSLTLTRLSRPSETPASTTRLANQEGTLHETTERSRSDHTTGRHHSPQSNSTQGKSTQRNSPEGKSASRRSESSRSADGRRPDSKT